MVAYLNTTILVICLHVREAQRLREHDMRLFAAPTNNVRLDTHASRSTDRSADRALRSAAEATAASRSSEQQQESNGREKQQQVQQAQRRESSGFQPK